MPNGPATATHFLESLTAAPADPALAIVFPGQGSQKVGMGRDVFESFPSARDVFNFADEALQVGLSTICFEGPEEALTSTDNAQPAILTASLAYLAAAVEAGTIRHRPSFLAGHSLGEYTALVAAGSLGLREALMVVRERGRLMATAGETNPGMLAAILGLDESTTERICSASGAEPANYNLSTQIVIGGTHRAIEHAMKLAKEHGGKALPVKVSGAFHTSLMKSAADEFATIVEDVVIRPPQIAVMSNVTGMPMTTADEIRRDLGEQIMRPVRWQQIIEFMSSAGVNEFTEVGPGRILTNMLKRAVPDAHITSIDSVAALGAASHV
jgi:[acyl-carrier-protein] S-malonyltransferase